MIDNFFVKNKLNWSVLRQLGLDVNNAVITIQSVGAALNHRHLKIITCLPCYTPLVLSTSSVPRPSTGSHDLEIGDLIKRFESLLFNEQLSDVDFVVHLKDGSEARIPAHKCILITGLDYFRNLLTGGLANDTKELDIGQVEPIGMRTLLTLCTLADVCSIIRMFCQLIR